MIRRNFRKFIRLLTFRWIEDFAEDMRAWKYLCKIIGKSDFCLGRIDGKNWMIDLSRVTIAKQDIKFNAGSGTGGSNPTPPPSNQNNGSNQSSSTITSLVSTVSNVINRPSLSSLLTIDCGPGSYKDISNSSAPCVLYSDYRDWDKDIKKRQYI